MLLATGVWGPWPHLQVVNLIPGGLVKGLVESSSRLATVKHAGRPALVGWIIELGECVVIWKTRE